MAIKAKYLPTSMGEDKDLTRLLTKLEENMASNHYTFYTRVQYAYKKLKKANKVRISSEPG